MFLLYIIIQIILMQQIQPEGFGILFEINYLHYYQKAIITFIVNSICNLMRLLFLSSKQFIQLVTCSLIQIFLKILFKTLMNNIQQQFLVFDICVIVNGFLIQQGPHLLAGELKNTVQSISVAQIILSSKDSLINQWFLMISSNILSNFLFRIYKQFKVSIQFTILNQSDLHHPISSLWRNKHNHVRFVVYSVNQAQIVFQNPSFYRSLSTFTNLSSSITLSLYNPSKSFVFIGFQYSQLSSQIDSYSYSALRFQQISRAIWEYSNRQNVFVSFPINHLSQAQSTFNQFNLLKFLLYLRSRQPRLGRHSQIDPQFPHCSLALFGFLIRYPLIYYYSYCFYYQFSKATNMCLTCNPSIELLLLDFSLSLLSISFFLQRSLNMLTNPIGSIILIHDSSPCKSIQIINLNFCKECGDIYPYPLSLD
ncbi:unnamed protein product (macronuclear) [Paramecium tetraurelia]|uniref:Transmembrane protein n=1 Tax=Paramecium tetraurelia TaxID=5888 RepID=A0BRH9_PARTE|nr:uncharacterized protein GSPATT00031377001 [Paramecium tetraurelia]CAK61146.1 unnamed protein product [Paramecium tetraurelia]|eukprot:XP_001428544.1 hypothetical protein (macronuclear) [Paramecium tetraurelia strain d4-2]